MKLNIKVVCINNFEHIDPNCLIKYGKTSKKILCIKVYNITEKYEISNDRNLLVGSAEQ